jgi:hypothetical protein
MSEMSQQIAVFVIYETRASVETAVESLVSEGFSSRDISVLLPESAQQGFRATGQEWNSNKGKREAVRSHGLLGGTLGVLAGLSMLAIPGLGPLVGEGTLKAGLAGLGVKNAVGDVARSLMNIGVPELDAKRYEDRLQQRTILVSVRCDTPGAAERATDILKRTGAEDLCTVVQYPSDTRDSTSEIASKTARRFD